ncbi:hypothetical protein L2E82_47364 [Cichorium intybus]|uniref:Uncharacterized protein n=1 Tax=Cichorium intybus TaxID=13427 RepID=A0ACB8YVU5_CICIN|nr:hypothetical protein L2E82_47364 [Cichorium intybus]
MHIPWVDDHRTPLSKSSNHPFPSPKQLAKSSKVDWKKHEWTAYSSIPTETCSGSDSRDSSDTSDGVTSPTVSVDGASSLGIDLDLQLQDSFAELVYYHNLDIEENQLLDQQPSSLFIFFVDFYLQLGFPLTCIAPIPSYKASIFAPLKLPVDVFVFDKMLNALVNVYSDVHSALFQRTNRLSKMTDIVNEPTNKAANAWNNYQGIRRHEKQMANEKYDVMETKKEWDAMDDTQKKYAQEQQREETVIQSGKKEIIEKWTDDDGPFLSLLNMEKGILVKSDVAAKLLKMCDLGNHTININGNVYTITAADFVETMGIKSGTDKFGDLQNVNLGSCLINFVHMKKGMRNYLIFVARK